MDQIKTKLDRLSSFIEIEKIIYNLRIEKFVDPKTERELWDFQYIDFDTDNIILEIIHKSLQVCIDETFHSIKVMTREPSRELIERINNLLLDWLQDLSCKPYLKDPNTDFVSEFDIDSLDKVELEIKFEKEFNIQFNEEEEDDSFMNIRTLSELYHLINNKLK